MIAACDTFRSGAVEQLRTHCCRLKALHPKKNESDPEKVILYDKGYGKDAAAVSMEAIGLGKILVHCFIPSRQITSWYVKCYFAAF